MLWLQQAFMSGGVVRDYFRQRVISRRKHPHCSSSVNRLLFNCKHDPNYSEALNRPSRSHTLCASPVSTSIHHDSTIQTFQPSYLPYLSLQPSRMNHQGDLGQISCTLTVRTAGISVFEFNQFSRFATHPNNNTCSSDCFDI